ncbi:sulfurtransferase complex subunit TusB [Dasania sp. GY-MA-18]|uniref:Sulfurtransferase complex subunit TusB n=1 Tax=Dasania phycosphaerae TaxID=2950436 RepID=A0A9J6RRZ8_9GAMM|nr:MULTISPECIES: sulfurtransferase complex subunit TusB [Dasania]MCR8924290.1 sulfurtransferase complex subunit TusB [Dasania sp. GY-MA-18]MCZ0866943.1 sulfurtransferase complex subunit TusB [Dasania phycosphaerae]MCZ0870447.1 sulfurtransferase complex subunit TusB [Dasania phycosphaerae]
MSSLHIVNKSPLSHSCLDECLSCCQQGDELLLIEDGVLALSSLKPQQLDKLNALGLQPYVLAADVAARGLSTRLLPPFQSCDDTGFVDLCVKHPKSISWF